MYGRQLTFARALAASFAAVLLYCGGVAWAGGNTAFRNPSNLSQVVNKVWDERMLPIPWLLSQDGIPGSAIDNATLTAELSAAFATWEAVVTAQVAFAFGGEIDQRQTGLGGPLGPGIDGRNLITFTDPDLLFPPGVLAVAITFSFAADTVITAANNDLDGDGLADIPTGAYPAGTIFDGDIAFNSSEPWNTTGASGTIDVRAVALHEIGHLLGLAHTCIRDGVMWPFLASDIAAARTLKADDVAYASFFYPQEPAYSATFGTIQGQVINGFSSAPILGAHVFAVDPLSGASMVGAYTGDDGGYVIPGLPGGQDYLVAIEPLDGDPPGLDPFRINEVIQFTFDTHFPEEFFDANEANVEADPLAGLAVAVTSGIDTLAIDLVTNTVQVPGVNRIFETGYNLFAYPVAVPAGLTAYDLLPALGSPAEVHSIDRFVPATATFERAEYQDGSPAGANFPIARGAGYLVHMGVQGVVGFAGNSDCPALDLTRGLNLVGVPCPPAGYTAFNLLQDIGGAFEVRSVERYSAATTTFDRAEYDLAGAPTGNAFPIVHGEGYVVTMLADKVGVKIPSPGSTFAPVITSLSPGRGVPGTIVVVSGEGFDPDVTKNTVTFNGIGAGIVFATSTTLTVTVPATAASGPVRAIVRGQISNAIDFQVDGALVAEDPSGTTELVSGQTATGTLSADGEQDRYTFTALAGSLVTATAHSITPGVPDLVLVLEDPNGIAVVTDDNGGGGTDPKINNHVLQSTGVHTVVVSSVPGSGTGGYQLNLVVTPRAAPPQVSILGGNFQTGMAGTVLPQPLMVFITGATGAAVAGVPVTFVANDAGFGGSAVGPINAGTTVITTNASGLVSVATTLPAANGTFTIQVTAPGAPPVTFTVAATNKAIATITQVNDLQQGPVAQPLPNPLEVILQDGVGAPVANALVAFAVAGGGGSVALSSGTACPAPAGQVCAQTDVNGKAGVTFTLGQLIKDAQLVATAVPGQSKPLLFSATPKAGPPATVHSNTTNFNRLTLGTARLNALQVEVLDQFDNPVAGVTVNYNAPAGLTVAPGLGPGGKLFADFMTNTDGLHVARVTAELSATPTLNELGLTGTVGLAPTYAISATPVGGPTQVYNVDVDMGPTMVTGSIQNVGAKIGQPLPSPVQKLVLRFERVDTFVDANGDGQDDDRGRIFDEDFSPLAEKAVAGVPVNFEVKREDGKDEQSVGLQRTRTAAPSATTNGSGLASVGVTMGDVGGVNHVTGRSDSITVTWTDLDGVQYEQKQFAPGDKFAESTNVIAIPVVITTTVADAGSGIAMPFVRATLNGAQYFTGVLPQATLPPFPRRLELVADGVALTALPADLIAGSAFATVKVIYSPAAPDLVAGSNEVRVEAVKDRVENEQAAVTTFNFNYP